MTVATVNPSFICSPKVESSTPVSGSKYVLSTAAFVCSLALNPTANVNESASIYTPPWVIKTSSTPYGREKIHRSDYAVDTNTALSLEHDMDELTTAHDKPNVQKIEARLKISATLSLFTSLAIIALWVLGFGNCLIWGPCLIASVGVFIANGIQLNQIDQNYKKQ